MPRVNTLLYMRTVREGRISCVKMGYPAQESAVPRRDGRQQCQKNAGTCGKGSPSQIFGRQSE